MASSIAKIATTGNKDSQADVGSSRAGPPNHSDDNSQSGSEWGEANEGIDPSDSASTASRQDNVGGRVDDAPVARTSRPKRGHAKGHKDRPIHSHHRLPAPSEEPARASYYNGMPVNHHYSMVPYYSAFVPANAYAPSVPGRYAPTYRSLYDPPPSHTPHAELPFQYPAPPYVHHTTQKSPNPAPIPPPPPVVTGIPSAAPGMGGPAPPYGMPFQESHTNAPYPSPPGVGQVPYLVMPPPPFAPYAYPPPPRPPATELPDPPATPPPPPDTARERGLSEELEASMRKKDKEDMARRMEEMQKVRERKIREELEASIRKKAEEDMVRRIQDLQKAQEEARVEIEKAKEEAILVARRHLEQERRLEEEKGRAFQAQMAAVERETREKLEAEMKRRAEAEAAERVREAEMMKRAREAVLREMEDERRRAAEEAAAKELFRAQVRAEIRAEEAEAREEAAAAVAAREDEAPQRSPSDAARRSRRDTKTKTRTRPPSHSWSHVGVRSASDGEGSLRRATPPPSGRRDRVEVDVTRSASSHDSQSASRRDDDDDDWFPLKRQIQQLLREDIVRPIVEALSERVDRRSIGGILPMACPPPFYTDDSVGRRRRRHHARTSLYGSSRLARDSHFEPPSGSESESADDKTVRAYGYRRKRTTYGDSAGRSASPTRFAVPTDSSSHSRRSRSFSRHRPQPPWSDGYDVAPAGMPDRERAAHGEGVSDPETVSEAQAAEEANPAHGFQAPAAARDDDDASAGYSRSGDVVYQSRHRGYATNSKRDSPGVNKPSASFARAVPEGSVQIGVEHLQIVAIISTT
ncbi:hypothetical protein VTK73DRAFT_8656 [Phialemonium thermophilum]|uniref:Uncharacterized protein n=1 Tax=Phialemonium thermophilum TaxID=223376 RepID=A0ABR3XNS3_9PEZI